MKKNAEPINSPPSKSPETITLQDLIKIEWEIIEKLKTAADEAKFERHRAQLYLALSSHVKTVAQILKMSGAEPGAGGEDLAKLLERISKKARRIARGLALSHGKGTYNAG